MCNLIKMELYRLWHATSTRVILIVTVGLVAAFMAMTALVLEVGTQLEESTVTGVESGTGAADGTITYGIYVDEADGWSSEEVEMAEIVATTLQSSLLFLMCVILVATYVYADQKNGYIKNIAGQFPKRGKLVAAKFAAVAIAVLVLLAVDEAVTLIGIKCIWKSNAHLDSFAELMKISGVHYLLLLGVSAAVLWITIRAKSSSAGVVLGVLLSCGISSTVYELINLLIQKIVPGTDFDISLYTLENSIHSYSVGAASGETIRAIVLSVVYGALAVGAAAWIMRKRDVV